MRIDAAIAREQLVLTALRRSTSVRGSASMLTQVPQSLVPLEMTVIPMSCEREQIGLFMRHVWKGTL
jgi:hypothetical protein